MAIATPIRVVVNNGAIRMVHHDGLVSHLKGHGKVHTTRASHVEPYGNGLWYADMSPVDGPMLDGFESREEALAAERQWLADNGY